ncbi:hypothetical protein [Bacillus smithii]|uniref:Uncharacterized protein n=1 Tax=Bacillus smithii 7_3_47FAA TaxID=665952 RepID=G9QIQ6_9BACI|nr:hypothetical protein [Bacillus smithii]EHL78974.1 hypothetical protein HMPREF1015_02983 [Bacillus smithii 7_3_47FAA]
MEEQQKQEQQGQQTNTNFPTSGQIETVAKAEYDKLVSKLEEVKSKLPKELTEEEKAIKAKEKELFDKEVKLTLKEEGLEAFADIVKVNDEKELKDVVKKLTSIVNDIKVSLGYVPSDHKQQTEYDMYAQKKDTKGMISTKLANLFKY